MNAKLLLFSTVLLVSNFLLRAQFVTIPDPNFVVHLETWYPTCITGDQLDTTCVDVTDALFLDVSGLGIADLDGMQYFDNLENLQCQDNALSTLPSLQAPLNWLNCSNNDIVSLPALPASLYTLYIDNNPLTILPAMPPLLDNFHADGCATLVPPAFSSTLTQCSLYGCGLTSVPPLPASLLILNIGNNPLVSTSGLPSGLLNLFCSDLALITLSDLPSELVYLEAKNGLFENITSFPSALTEIVVSGNNLTSIPALPDSLFALDIANNNVSTIEAFTALIGYLDITNNNIHCLPWLPDSLYFFEWAGNPLTCVPNYPESVDGLPTLSGVPLCESDDLTYNPYGCPSAIGVIGSVYRDNDSDCALSGADTIASNIPIHLFDASFSLLSTINSSSDGSYFFGTLFDDFIVQIDTVEKPYVVNCTWPGIDTAVTVMPPDSVVSDLNFFIECPPGFDIGVQSIWQSGAAFPTWNHNVLVAAGDMAGWFGLNCAAGTSGVVNVNISGPVEYIGPAVGSLTPSVTGLNLTYLIPDFGAVDMWTDFVTVLWVDSLAVLGDSICIDVTVTPTAGDNNPANNNFTFCYPVVTSYDPNNKLVFPTVVEPGYEDYLYYTINFQNTGTAPAMNVRLRDTLSTDFDLSSFEVVGYSHENNFSLQGNKLVGIYPNIFLPDSTSDEPGSHGFFQYRIKPVSGLPNGTVIENTAHIFFDYNDPVVTNTAKTYFGFTDAGDIITQEKLNIYPNPSNGSFYIDGIELTGNYRVEFFDVLGRKLDFSISKSGNLVEIDLQSNYTGVGLILIEDEVGVSRKTIVIR